MPSLMSKDLIHITLEAAVARALYSDSVLDLETTVCFLKHHETMLGLKKTEYPVIDFLSSLSLA